MSTFANGYWSHRALQVSPTFDLYLINLLQNVALYFYFTSVFIEGMVVLEFIIMIIKNL